MSNADSLPWQSSLPEYWSLTEASPQFSVDNPSSFGLQESESPPSVSAIVSQCAPVHKDQAAWTLKASKHLLAPIPNLFKGTFELAHRQSSGEQWLLRKVKVFDEGGRRKRKQVLEEFLEFLSNSSVSSMEELFSNAGHLFFVRLTSWFSVMLPLLYELPLQLKVFLAFLEFQEQSFVRSFFESGAVMTIMDSLSVDYDVPDNVRCLAILVIHRLVVSGRKHKEILCSHGLIRRIVECVADSLEWETLKSAGQLLCELFRSNPGYQKDLIQALLALMSKQQRPLTQRVGMQATVGLLSGQASECSALLRDSSWHQQVVPRAEKLLQSQDLRVCADSYCLLCRLLRNFSCDGLLFDFARAELQDQIKDKDQWLRLEIDAIEAQAVQVEPTSANETLERKKGARSGPKRCFRTEASHVLRLSLILFLAKRNSDLCDELVDDGLTETLLVCLLDMAHPMRQGAVLSELHRLQLLSAKARHIAEAILVKQDFLRAMTLEQFLRAGSPDDFSRARFRLRNMWGQYANKALPKEGGRKRVPRHAAAEHQLQQKLIEYSIADTFGEEPKEAVSGNSGAFFLTEGLPEEEAAEEVLAKVEAKADDALKVPRAGSKTYAVQRVPLRTPPDRSAEANGYGIDRTQLEDVSIEEPPILASLFSLIADPLDIAAEGGSPLLEELKKIGPTIINDGSVVKRSTTSSRRKGRKDVVQAKLDASHQPSIVHQRAMALRPLGPRGIENRLAAQSGSRRAHSLHGTLQLSTDLSEQAFAPSEAASSEITELSLHIGGPVDPWAAGESLTAEHSRHCRSMGSCDHSDFHHHSLLAETTVGPDASQEFSHDHLYHQSSEFHSTSRVDDLTPHSLMEDGLMIANSQAESDTAQWRLLDKSPLTALLEVPRLPLTDLVKPKKPKMVLHVSSAPYHRCVAFSDREEFKLASSAEVTKMLDPTTKQRFQDINDIGKFPRRLLRSSGPSRRQEEAQLAGKPSFSSRFGPQSARQPSESRLYTPSSSFEMGEPGIRSAREDVLSHRSDVLKGAGIFSELSLAVERSGGSSPMNLKDFFPASAR
eukprot:TRINITY_DN4727_c2_g2_i1.p1 TRINITY_DN4727_c2_g2~~TRINITY_DN4727_c2_g2_i1.p1  ORF type:complete len:1058 (+),score=179.44 TRINITY_DN4727_c2_g2_i1:73-3246(+)